jgi:hypothetical protein
MGEGPQSVEVQGCCIEFVLSRVLRAEIKSQQLRPHNKLVGRMGGWSARGGSPEVARPTAINPPTNIT